jgi:hypothetical protein
LFGAVNEALLKNPGPVFGCPWVPLGRESSGRASTRRLSPPITPLNGWAKRAGDNHRAHARPFLIGQGLTACVDASGAPPVPRPLLTALPGSAADVEVATVGDYLEALPVSVLTAETARQGDSLGFSLAPDIVRSHHQ